MINPLRTILIDNMLGVTDQKEINLDELLGKQLSIKVIEIEGETAFLEVGGFEIKAQMPRGYLMPGEEFIGCFSGITREGQFVLQRLDETNNLSESFLLHYSDPIRKADVKQILDRLNLPDNQLNKDIIKLLYDKQLPLNRDNIAIIARCAVKESVQTPEQLNNLVETFLFCQERGLPLNSKIISLLNSFLHHKHNLSEPLKQIVEMFPFLSDYQGELTELIQTVEQLIDFSVVDSKKLQTKLKILGLVTSNKETAHIPEYLNYSGEEKGYDDLLLILVKLSKSLLFAGGKDGQVEEKKMLEKSVKQIIEHLFAQRISNTQANNLKQDGVGELVFTIPLSHNERIVDTSIRLRFKKRNKTMDDDFLFKLTLKLDLTYLGLVIVDITSYHQKELVVNFKMENQIKSDYLDGQLSLLNTGLTRLGYKDSKLLCTKSEQPTYNEKRQGSNEELDYNWVNLLV